MALTAQGIVERAAERREKEALARTDREKRHRLQYLRFLESHTHRFRYNGIFQIGPNVYQFPLIVVTERPLALVVEVQCPNQACRFTYSISQFTAIREDMFWMPCPECHWPITLRNTSFVYPNNTYPVQLVMKGMKKRPAQTLRYENWLRFVIDGIEKMIKERPDFVESVLWDADDAGDYPEVRMRTCVESDEETKESVSKEILEGWGFGKAEIPEKYAS